MADAPAHVYRAFKHRALSRPRRGPEPETPSTASTTPDPDDKRPGRRPTERALVLPGSPCGEAALVGFAHSCTRARSRRLPPRHATRIRAACDAANGGLPPV